ncbi:hypothetical protein [Streptomyces camelliae]|uniref:SH3 domain-containing protein n=1 Tax=Streptomyces camelliae TaxID=3004093 RepID=A0ABY7P4H0_9ACTN|nr:hypothetical protein [Streptomyces sp. HUAS 2-6]WBO65421.1 hypothetical protein O1G22_22640 [Streptomyces sp. HUAS 2-6]
MRIRFGRRAAMAVTAAALSVGAIVTTAGTASAADAVQLTTSHWVGIYADANTNSKIGWPDLAPGDWIYANCWKVGQSIGSYGDTWYQVSYVDYEDGYGWRYVGTGYTFAGYVDNNAHTVNRDPNIPQC